MATAICAHSPSSPSLIGGARVHESTFAHVFNFCTWTAAARAATIAATIGHCCASMFSAAVAAAVCCCCCRRRRRRRSPPSSPARELAVAAVVAWNAIDQRAQKLTGRPLLLLTYLVYNFWKNDIFSRKQAKIVELCAVETLKSGFINIKNSPNKWILIYLRRRSSKRFAKLKTVPAV